MSVKGRKNMNRYVLSFQELDLTKLMIAGGKGANLGVLSRIEGILVPAGFCITTDAYKRITENDQELNSLLDELTLLNAEERTKISGISARVRMAIEGKRIPNDITEEIAGYITKFGDEDYF
jgi:phosphoenolpyruvate synthase/pyruvate phosphate dikinase